LVAADIKQAKREGAKVLKVIHGYGSSGSGQSGLGFGSQYPGLRLTSDLPDYLETANHGHMKAKGLAVALVLLLLGGGGCQPSAEQTKAFHAAANRGDLEQVKALLKSEPKLVFSKDTNGMTALHLAALFGYKKKVVELLLASNAEFNAKDRRGHTPLGAARGHENLVSLRRQHGGYE